MDISNIPLLRLQNQLLLNSKLKTPEEVVSYLGAVQSQDFMGAKWALGLRLPGSKDQDIEKAFNKGKILRTHALRPTWHFITPEDIRWIVKLNAPQVKKLMGYYNRILDLDDHLFLKSNAIIANALRGKNLTRRELQAELKKHGISGTGQRIGHIIMSAELDGIICSGPRIGKQFSYALIDEVAPKTRPITRDEALAKLARIFFKSRGPATIKDFSKWSGLSISDSKKGLDAVEPHFQSVEIDGKVYFLSASLPSTINHQPTALLLPNYDEYISSYADYSIIADLEKAKNLELKGNALFWNHILINGRIEGSYRRVFKSKAIEIQLAPFKDLIKSEMKGIEKAARDFGKFFGLSVQLT